MTEELVIFETIDKKIKLSVPVKDNTVWLNRKQISELFDRDIKTVGKHINNALLEELNNIDEVVVANFATTTRHGAIEGKKQTHLTEYYSLDVIISVGYRVKSKRGIEFRKWANSVLKKYIIDGYVLNEKRLKALEKTVEIQSKMLSDSLNINEDEIAQTIKQYTKALLLLDEYDHQSLKKPNGNENSYILTYKECNTIVNKLKTSFDSNIFGVEKQKGKVEGIIKGIYQTVFEKDAYPSIEEKAANLLYFMVKDHPYEDGCKRIAASLFLYFLNKNKLLFNDGKKRISDGELVALTLLLAESEPKEKDVMIVLTMNLLNKNNLE